jgi:type IV secretory pathway TrbD component
MAGRRSNSDRAGLHVPVHRALTEPILLGGAPRAIAILNGTLAGAVGLGLRLWLVGLAIWAIGHFASRSGPPSAIRSSSMSCAAICASPHLRGLREASHDEPRRISQPHRRLADFLPWAALVGEGVVLNKDGSFQRTARFAAPISTARRPPNWSPSPGGSTTPCAASAPAGRSSSRRSAAAATYPAEQFPDPASALVDAERKADFEEEGAHFESSYFLTFLYLPPAEDAARAESWLYEGRAQSGVDPRMRCCAASPTAPTACCAARRLHARGAAGSMTARR